MKTLPDFALRFPLATLAAAILLTSPAAHAAILVGAGGIDNNGTVIDFAGAPLVSNWSTGSLTGSHSTYTTAAQITAAVQSAVTPGTTISTALASFANNYTGADGFKHQTIAAHLSSSPTQGGGGLNALQATLQNSAGATIDSFEINFDFGVQAAGTEQVPGFVVYYNTTTNPAQWQQLGQVSTAGPQTFAITPAGGWLDGTTLFLLWADDNAQSSTDGSYTLDNFKVTTVVAPEPGRAMLMLLGATFMMSRRRRA